MTIRVNGNRDSRRVAIDSPTHTATSGTLCYLGGDGCWLNKLGVEETIVALIRVAKNTQKDCWVDDEFAAKLLKELYYNA